MHPWWEGAAAASPGPLLAAGAAASPAGDSRTSHTVHASGFDEGEQRWFCWHGSQPAAHGSGGSVGDVEAWQCWFCQHGRRQGEVPIRFLDPH